MHLKHIRAISSLVVAGSLSACSITPHFTEKTSAESLIAKNLQDSLGRIEKTQAELVQAGGIEQARTGLSSQIYLDNQSVNFEWYGDASTALQKLANQRGYGFHSSGVKLPLPVAINVKNISYTALLQRLQTQIGYRASVDIDHNRREISLRYTQPNARGADSVSTLQITGQPYAGAKPLISGNAVPSTPTGVSYNPLREFSHGGAKSQSLEVAVRQIIPVGWKADISEPVLKKYKAQRFSWEGNDWWPKVLDRTLQGTSIKTAIESSTKRVVLTDATLTAPPMISSKSSLIKEATVPTMGLLSNSKPVVLSKVNKAPGILLSSVPVGQEWVAKSGTTLKESITDWASHAKCARGGSWIVMWPTSVDYGIEAPVTFKGNFEEAIVKMFDLYSAAEKPLYVLANRNQCLIAVDDKPQSQ